MHALLPVLLLGACGSRTPAEPPARPSVLLVTLDTTRADRLGPYGYALAETPTCDRLAAEGTTFLRAYSSCPLTIPAHSTIFTGRHPPSHGVRDNGDFILGPEAITLAERLKDAGFTTAAFTSAFPTQRRWGFDQGFDVYRDPLERLPTQLDWRDQRRADEVIDEALEILPQLDGPVFAWVHLFDAHWPYDPPEPYRSRHDGRPYDGEIAFADAQVGRLLDWWDAEHPDSIVIVTADHGEGLGDGGEQTHGFLLHDGTMRVPMLVRGPGVERGARVDDPVGLVDVAPTVLALVGLDRHEELQGHDMREGGSTAIYSEALTGQFNLGLAPLYAWTDSAGRYMEGGWGGFYPLLDEQRVGTTKDPQADIEPMATRLGAFRASLDEVIAPTAALDDESLELLTALGYIGGDPAAEAGTVDPRDVIDVIPLTWQARQAISAGAFGPAQRMVDELEARMPGTFGVDLLRAQLLRTRGELGPASERYADLFLRSPSSTLALQLAGIQAALGDWEDAAGWYDEALQLQPHSPEAMAGLVRSYQAQGEEALAEELADRFLLLYPDHAQLSLIRAEMHLADTQPERALAEAEQALEKMPWSPWAHTVAAQALWELGRADAAIERLNEALRIDPFDLAVRMRLADCLADVGRNAEAVRALAPAARLLPDEEEIQKRYATVQAALATERSR